MARAYPSVATSLWAWPQTTTEKRLESRINACLFLKYFYKHFKNANSVNNNEYKKVF